MNAIDRVKKSRGINELAEQIEPLAQSMATLADEARQVMSQTQQASEAQAAEWLKAQRQTGAAWVELAKELREVAAEVSSAAQSARSASRGWHWKLWLTVMLASMMPTVVLLALARPDATDNRGRLDLAALGGPLKNDRTLQAIGRQLKAMGCERFDIGVRDATTGQMMNREWSAAEVLQNTPWLKRMNAQGNDVYIRPAEQERHGLVLVDDLSEFDLDDMKAEGREPALVVETSPKNYQAWVKVADAAGGELRGQIARTLASEYDADPASADSRHYGRLAGFTNRKDKHTTRAGYQPWVLLRESKGKTATAGPALVQQAGQQIEQAQRQQEKARRLASLELPERQLSRHRRTALDEYRSEMAGLVKRFGDDLSKCDFIAAQKLASRGRSAEEIGKAMAEASPALAERKPGHEADYIERTVSKVMGLPSVQLARAELARAPAPRQRGMDRGGPDFSM